MRAVKLTTILLLAFSMQLAARTDAQSVTLFMKNVPLKVVLREIQKQTGLNIIANESMLLSAGKVTIKAKNMPVDKALENCFKDKPLSFELVDRTIVIRQKKIFRPDLESFKEIKQKADTIITGRVSDEKNAPLSGASISLLNKSSSGTTTDANGNFKINAVAGDVLVISFVGYASQQVSVNEAQQINITLQPEASSLNDVVVVGYGAQKRASITGSVASIQSDKITSVKVPSVANALAGRLPGLRAVQRSGAPGDDVAQIDIRGFGTPLVLVDGVERDFTQIDANDIESISILKDASAAVYGFKGANGVILVTTKKGKTGKPTISYNGYYGLQTDTRFPELFNSHEYASLYNEAQMNVGVRAPYTEEELEKYKAGNDPDYPNNDWWDLMTRDFTPMMYHNVSVSGGVEKIKYFFSVGYTNQQGIWASKEENFKKYTIRSNVSAEITDGLNVGLELSGRLDNQYQPYDAGRFHTYFKVRPDVPIYANNNPDYYQAIGDNVNPIQGLYSDEMGYDIRDRREFTGSLIFNWQLPWVEGLSAKALLAYNYNNQVDKQWFKEYGGYQYDAVTDAYSKAPRHVLSELNSRTDNSFAPTQQYSLSYQRAFGRSDINALALWEMKNYRLDWVSAYRQFYISAIDQMNAGDNVNRNNGGNADHRSSMGLVGRINYAFDSKYLAEVSFRNDGSYKFAESRRWGFFPAVSLGWVVSKENFFRDNISFVDNLKIRGSYGKIGDEGDFAAFQYLTGYNYPSGNYVLGSGGVLNGIQDRGLPNLNLTWYESTTANIGLEASVLRGLFSAEFDYFERRRDGLLANRLLTLPTTFGQTLPQENLNSDRTRGFEIVLGHRNTIGKVSYRVNANFTSTREFNRYVERAAPANMYENWRFNTNERYKSITWGYEATGQFQNFEEILNAPVQDGNGNKSILPGDIRYRDLNGDGIISSLDQKPIGHSNIPSMYYGLDLSANWNNFDFSAFFQGAAGHEIGSLETYTDPFIQKGLGNGVIFWLDRWHRADPKDMNSEWVPGYMPAVRPSGFSLNNEMSTWTLMKQDYIRLKTIELGYTLPNSLTNKAGLKSLRVYVNSYNALTLTKGRRMKYMDPENGDAFIKTYPQLKSFNFGLNLTL